MLKGLGVEAITIPTLANGTLDFEGIEALLHRLRSEGRIDRLKAVYLISYFSNPSARSLSLEEKEGLAHLLKGEDLLLPIFEDTAYRELYFGSEYAVPSVLSLEAYRDFPCLYLGTFSKSLSPGLKCGYGISNQRDWLSKITYIKGHHDFGTTNWNQSIIEQVLSTGSFHDYLASIRPKYEAKAMCLMDALEQSGLKNDGWSWNPMKGGLMAWLSGPEHLDTSIGSTFHARALENDILYVPGDLCYAEGDVKNCIRLSTGPLNGERLHEGVERLAKVYHSL
jgi:2-aminoadipate transaminase